MDAESLLEKYRLVAAKYEAMSDDELAANSEALNADIASLKDEFSVRRVGPMNAFLFNVAGIVYLPWYMLQRAKMDAQDRWNDLVDTLAQPRTPRL